MITTEQYQAYEQLFDYFNIELFGGALHPCILNFSRAKSQVHGHFAPDRWDRNGEKAHEISLNPECLSLPPKEICSTLVHEQCHMWQQDNGKPSRSGYHNKQWGAKMKEVGLYPSNTGAEGGKETGQQMTHYIIADGPFDKAFSKLTDADFLPFKGVPSPVKPGKVSDKTKYECSCGNKVWGKPGLLIMCEDCNNMYIEC